MGERKTGGADLVIVIASPMEADERSKKRFIAKVHGYLSYVASPEFRMKCGDPTPSSTCLIVHIDEDSDYRIFELIEQCRGWVEESMARLETEELKAAEPGATDNPVGAP